MLHDLLAGAGFTVERRVANVGGAELPNHMALVVDVDGEEYLADAGLGEGPLDPVPLVDGATTPGPMSWTVRRTDDGWRLEQHEWGSVAYFTFGDPRADLDDFQPHHRRLSREPESSFVQTLVVQRPFDDRIVTLRSRTLSVDGPGEPRARRPARRRRVGDGAARRVRRRPGGAGGRAHGAALGARRRAARGVPRAHRVKYR